MINSVLVTGASTGLGLETALYLAEQGFAVYATTLDRQDHSAIDEPARKRGLNIRVLHLDITDPKSIDSAVQTVVRESGGIYGLVNNAGTRLRGCFEDLAESEIRRLFDTNVFGTMAVTRAALPHMRISRRGRIVMITSVAGRMGAFGSSSYCSTKFAQEGFGESLAQEVTPFGVQVVLIEPGIVKTEAWSSNRVVAAGAQNPESPYYFWFQRSEHYADRLVETSPTRPNDVAKTVYLALTVKRPRLRYLVGSRAKFVFFLHRYLPVRLFEYISYSKVHRHVISQKPCDQINSNYHPISIKATGHEDD